MGGNIAKMCCREGMDEDSDKSNDSIKNKEENIFSKEKITNTKKGDKSFLSDNSLILNENDNNIFEDLKELNFDNDTTILEIHFEYIEFKNFNSLTELYLIPFKPKILFSICNDVIGKYDTFDILSNEEEKNTSKNEINIKNFTFNSSIKINVTKNFFKSFSIINVVNESKPKVIYGTSKIHLSSLQNISLVEINVALYNFQDQEIGNLKLKFSSKIDTSKMNNEISKSLKLNDLNHFISLNNMLPEILKNDFFDGINKEIIEEIDREFVSVTDYMKYFTAIEKYANNFNLKKDENNSQELQDMIRLHESLKKICLDKNYNIEQLLQKLDTITAKSGNNLNDKLKTSNISKGMLYLMNPNIINSFIGFPLLKIISKNLESFMKFYSAYELIDYCFEIIKTRKNNSKNINYQIYIEETIYYTSLTILKALKSSYNKKTNDKISKLKNCQQLVFLIFSNINYLIVAFEYNFTKNDVKNDKDDVNSVNLVINYNYCLIKILKYIITIYLDYFLTVKSSKNVNANKTSNDISNNEINSKLSLNTLIEFKSAFIILNDGLILKKISEIFSYYSSIHEITSDVFYIYESLSKTLNNEMTCLLITYSNFKSIVSLINNKFKSKYLLPINCLFMNTLCNLLENFSTSTVVNTEKTIELNIKYLVSISLGEIKMNYKEKNTLDTNYTMDEIIIRMIVYIFKLDRDGIAYIDKSISFKIITNVLNICSDKETLDLLINQDNKSNFLEDISSCFLNIIIILQEVFMITDDYREIFIEFIVNEEINNLYVLKNLIKTCMVNLKELSVNIDEMENEIENLEKYLK